MRPTTCHWCGEDYNDCNRCTHRGVYVEPERLALLERCAKDWARGQKLVDDEIGAKWCSHCKSSWLIHAHDCEAAEILGLEREEKG